MNTTRAALWGVGIVLILVSAYIFYFEANLSRWFSVTILAAGMLLFVGLLVLTFAGGRHDDSRTTVVTDEAATGETDTKTTHVKHT